MVVPSVCLFLFGHCMLARPAHSVVPVVPSVAVRFHNSSNNSKSNNNNNNSGEKRLGQKVQGERWAFAKVVRSVFIISNRKISN